MTKRMYFTDPVQALYMVREFGIKITQRDSDPGEPITTVDLSEKEMIEDLEYWNPRYEKENRLYVTKESTNIFTAKEGDILTDGAEYGEFCSSSPYDDMITFSTGDEGQCSTVRISKAKIIMRDNKIFFDSEVQDD